MICRYFPYLDNHVRCHVYLTLRSTFRLRRTGNTGSELTVYHIKGGGTVFTSFWTGLSSPP